MFTSKRACAVTHDVSGSGKFDHRNRICCTNPVKQDDGESFCHLSYCITRQRNGERMYKRLID